MARVLVGLSGGVDSAVAASLLLREGHEVVGAYMKNWTNAEGIPGDCPWEEDIRDAHAVCRALGIEFRVVDMTAEYRERIVALLLDGYRGGVTPNPDVWCNREMKFGLFLRYALDQGFANVATGHYARRRDVDGVPAVFRGADPNKDQSYFLALMTREQVVHAMFPTGAMLKPEVRAYARDAGLPVAAKKDSQGICFLGQVKMTDFLRHHIPDRPGDIVDTAGKVLGRHLGLHLYTLGQRKGHGVASPREGCAYVVVGKDPATNRLIVGWDDVSTSGLYARDCVVGSLQITDPDFRGRVRVEAQPRYRAKAEPAELEFVADDRVKVRFRVPQRALAAGQVCAFYDGGRLLGGGVFEQAGG